MTNQKEFIKAITHYSIDKKENISYQFLEIASINWVYLSGWVFISDTILNRDELLHVVNQINKKKQGGCIDDYFILEALKTIDTYLDSGSVNVKILSKAMKMSERHLQRKIKEATGKCPSELIKLMCLHKAKHTLLTTNQTVSQIALKYGFTSSSYFSKCFEKEFNIRPTEFIKKNKQDACNCKELKFFLENLITAIERHLENDTMSLEVLCKEMSMCKRQLQRKIKDTYHKTPVELINTIRLKKAKESLIKDDLSISETAFKFGFSSPSYFTKCFKKEFNITPAGVLKSSE